jgi:hypothetical protein
VESALWETSRIIGQNWNIQKIYFTLAHIPSGFRWIGARVEGIILSVARFKVDKSKSRRKKNSHL